MGYVARKNNIAKRDSTLVGTLRVAGAVFFPKTAMPQSGMALETVSNLWGRTTNPYNRDLGAGGSSGGDATLVALRGSPVTPSTDMKGVYARAGRFQRTRWHSTYIGSYPQRWHAKY